MDSKVKCTCGWSWNKSDSSKKDMYICHECGRDNSNNIPKAQNGTRTETPLVPYSNEYLDNLENDYLKMYNDPNTEMDDGYDKFYHSLIDNLPDVTKKAKGWVEYKPGTDIEEFTEDDGNTTAPIPGKNRMVKYVEDYEVSDRPNTAEQSRLTDYMQERAINKLDKRTVSNKKYDIDIPKQKNGGWLDNYNDSETSAPEGMIGDGYSNVGRDYSPAWGGQFAEGGEIDPGKKKAGPKKEKGNPATTADSLAVYNDVMRTKNYYETHNIKYFNKPEISPKWWADKKRMDRIKRDHLEHPDVTAANKQKIKQNKNPNQYLLSDMITGAIDPNAPLFRYDTRISPQGEITYRPKTYLQPALKKLDPNYDKLSTTDQLAIEDMLTGYSKEMTPEQILIYRKWKGKHPHDLKKMEALSKLDDEVSNHSPGYITTLPYYDPLAVKPYSLRTPQEKKDWQKKYGPTKTKDKDKPDNKNTTPVKRQPIQEIENLQPIGIQNDFNLEAPLPQIRQQVIQPKYYDVEDYTHGSTSYGGTQSNYRTDDLSTLSEQSPNNTRKIVPHYQMGGSVYPVNYVPQAQNGKLTFLQPTSEKLPEGYRIPYVDPSSERAMSIGGENGEPAYLIPSFKYGKPLYNAIEEFKKTGEHLGGPFKTWQEADKWENETRHPAVERKETIMFPQEKFAMGGSMPGAVGFTYARTQGAAPSNGKYAKKTMASAQYGKKQFKLKDERLEAINPSESTGIKKPNFELYKSKLNKTYVNQAKEQKIENTRRKKLTPDQREREDYNARNEETGTVQDYVPESTWDRTKAIVSNPLTAFGYVARNESLPARFQYGPRNDLDTPIDFINPLQGIAAASEIPGELGRGEYLNAGLSALDAVDLGVYAKGAKKLGSNQLKNLSPAMGFRDGGIIDSDRGQWDHPGEVTRINSNQITMGPDPKTGKPLTKPLLGISDTGDVKLMRPGGNYKFKGNKVTEYPIAQDGETLPGGQDIKVKDSKGKVKTINTGSSEYAEMYKSGNIQNPDAGEGDVPFFGGELDEIKLYNKRSPLAKAKHEYSEKHDREDFINQKKDEYVKRLGKSNWYGADRNNFPEAVLRDINANYDYDRNTAAINKVAKQKGWDLSHRDDWVDELSPAEREAVINSKYSADLNPNEFANTLSGIQQIGNTLLPGNPLKFPIYGLTPEEEKEDRNSMLSGLKTFSLMNTPGNAAANYLKNTNTSSYPEYRNESDNIPFVDLQRMGNVSETESMALNPLTYQAISALPEIVKGVGTLASKAKPLANEIIQNAPKIKNFAKDVAGDIGNTIDDVRDIQGKKDYVRTNADVDLNRASDFALTNTTPTINSWADFEQGYRNLSSDLHHAYENATNYEHSNATYDAVKKWGNKAIDKIGRNKFNRDPNATPEELQKLYTELVSKLPKAKEIETWALPKLRQSQFKRVAKKNEDFKILKNFAKNIGVKAPEVPKVDYTPKEMETIDAIRELGKYKAVAKYQKDKLFADPNAMAQINKEILKLDDEVVQNLLGVTKKELLETYKNVVPATKKTQVDITSNPIPTADLSLVDEYNTIQPNSLDDIHPLNEKQYHADPKPSLLQRVEQSYANNFAPIDYQTPSSYPESMIHMAKTDYTYTPILDANYNNVLDASGNVMYDTKLTSQGQVKRQLMEALRKVEDAPKDTNFIGSGSLSTDSYPLTLNSGILMMKKGLVEVNVQSGTEGLNGMGYTNTSPRLVIKDINSRIEELEKLSGKKLPRAKYNPNEKGTYKMYEVPRIYFTRLKQGGSINKADENSLVKLDQLTNFTNYNKPQPGGWLNKYN
jgi:hypothetical protein